MANFSTTLRNRLLSVASYGYDLRNHSGGVLTTCLSNISLTPFFSSHILVQLAFLPLLSSAELV